MKYSTSTAFLIFFCLLLLTEYTSAQTTTLDWVTSTGANGEDRIFDSKIDAQGNIYTVGVFNNTVDFDPSTNIYNLSSNGMGDGFVAKYKANGNLIWAKSFGSSFGKDIARKLAVDDSGNVYVSGFFTHSVDFNPDTGTYMLQSNGIEDAFLLKLDSSGNFQWTRAFGGNGFDYSLAVKFHPQGAILLSGTYTDSVDFDPDSAVLKKYGSNGENTFLSAFDRSGNLLWNNTFPTSNNYYLARGYEISIRNNGNFLLAGSFFGTVDFDASANNSVNHTSMGSSDCFILEYDMQGNYIWSSTFGGFGEDNITAIDIDSHHNIFIGGFYSGTVDFDAGSNSLSKTSNGNADSFISKLDSSKNLVWNVTSGGSSADKITNIITDQDGFVYATGYIYSSVVDMNPDSLIVNNIYHSGSGDTYLWQIDSSGNFISAFPVGNSGNDIGHALSFYNDDQIIFGGSYSSIVDFDPTSGTITKASNGNVDFFIEKLTICKQTEDSIQAFGCQYYISPSNKVYNATGRYLDTIVNAKGCDSVLTIQLTLNQLNTTVTSNDPHLYASTAQNVSYQWLDCINGYTAISSETQSTFTATQNGSYAVEITQGQCKDTSSCYQIISVSINKVENDDQISFHPNPSNGTFNAEFSENYINANYTVYNIQGKVVKEGRVKVASNFQIQLNEGSGIYLIKFESRTKGLLSTHKLMVN